MVIVRLRVAALSPKLSAHLLQLLHTWECMCQQKSQILLSQILLTREPL